MATEGISKSGKKAEELFRCHTGASKAPNKHGDACLCGRLVEIKKASTTTVNQVRAVKYIPLVILDSRDDSWFVVPPDEIVRQVADKKRGQHTENAFESATLSLTRLLGFRIGGPSQLKQATLKAIKRGDSHPELKNAMAEVLKKSKMLAVESRKSVLKLL